MTTETQPEATDADLRALAVRADNGETLDNDTQSSGHERADEATDPQNQGSTNDTTTQTGTALNSSEQAPRKEDKPATQPEAKAPEAKRESEYTKFLREKEQLQKEKQRLAQTWQQVQAEKERIRQPNQGQQQQPAAQQPPKPAGNPALAKYSLEDLHEAAADYEAEGNTRLARAVRQEIASRAQAPQQQPAQQTQPTTQAPGQIPREQFEAEWRGHLQTLSAQDKGLNDPASPIFKEMKEVIQFPYFQDHPSKVTEAYQFARMRIESRAAPELRNRIKKLESEITTLRKATSPGSGSAESRGSDKRNGDLNESDLRRMAEEHDANAA